MICVIKNKNLFYRKYLEDLWGVHIFYRKVSKAFNFMRVVSQEYVRRQSYYNQDFIFVFTKGMYFRRKKEFEPEFIDHRYLYSFYLVLRQYHFRKMYKKARKNYGPFIKNYLHYLEGRLYMIAYRSNFMSNIFMIRYLIHHGFFIVNEKIRTDYNYVIHLHDFIQVNYKYKMLVHGDLAIKCIRKNIIWKPPSYLFINYNFMFIIYLRKPIASDLMFPIDIDVYIGGEYYF